MYLPTLGLADINAELQQFAVDGDAPHSGFAADIVRISVRTSRGTVGRPTRRRLFQVQNRRNPWRCQAMTCLASR
jgi:hypothetical protein